MIKAYQRQSGFTLVEMLVYMFILLVVSAAAVYFLISLDRLITEYRLETALYRSGSSAMEQMVVNIRQAEQLDSLGSIIDDPQNGALEVSRDTSTTRFVRSATDETLELWVDDSYVGNIIGEGIVDVEHFTVFRHSTGDGELIRTRLHLSANLNGSVKTMTFYGGGVIRGDL